MEKGNRNEKENIGNGQKDKGGKVYKEKKGRKIEGERKEKESIK